MDYEKPIVIISKCLEHERCRYDGSMISSKIIKDLKKYVDFVPICPEMAIGLPSPRKSLRLIRVDGENRLIQNETELDKTEDMKQYVRNISKDIKGMVPDGFILKSRSPSCGIKSVKVYKDIGKSPTVTNGAKGIFAENIMEEFPKTIFEDEGRLRNFSIREHFYTVIFTMADFKKIYENPSLKELIDFHSKNKYLFMAYSQKHLKTLGSLVANNDGYKILELLNRYEETLNKLFDNKPSTGQYINVLMHIYGYFKDKLKDEEKAYFLDLLEEYRENHIPQSNILKLLYAWVLRFDMDYLKMQTVFNAFPSKLLKVTDSGKVM